MALVIFAIALIWAGTHELAVVYGERPEFSGTRWALSLGLLAAAGFVFANALRPVDIRAVIDWRRVGAVAGPPVVILFYCWISLEFQFDQAVLDTLLAWASPFGHGILATMLGIGVASGMQVRN